MRIIGGIWASLVTAALVYERLSLERRVISMEMKIDRLNREMEELKRGKGV